MGIARIERLEDGWSVMGLAPHTNNPETHGCLADLPEPTRSHLAVLLIAPVQFYEAQIGRRVSEDIFWVNTGADDG